MQSKYTQSARKWVSSLSPTATGAISERDIMALSEALEASAVEAEYHVVTALGDLSCDQATVLWDISRSANVARRSIAGAGSVRARTASELMVKLSDMLALSRAAEDTANKAIVEAATARKLREEDGLEVDKPRANDIWDVGPNSK